MTFGVLLVYSYAVLYAYSHNLTSS